MVEYLKDGDDYHDPVMAIKHKDTDHISFDEDFFNTADALGALATRKKKIKESLLSSAIDDLVSKAVLVAKEENIPPERFLIEKPGYFREMLPYYMADMAKCGEEICCITDKMLTLCMDTSSYKKKDLKEMSERCQFLSTELTCLKTYIKAIRQLVKYQAHPQSCLYLNNIEVLLASDEEEEQTDENSINGLSKIE